MWRRKDREQGFPESASCVRSSFTPANKNPSHTRLRNLPLALAWLPQESHCKRLDEPDEKGSRCLVSSDLAPARRGRLSVEAQINGTSPLVPILLILYLSGNFPGRSPTSPESDLPRSSLGLLQGSVYYRQRCIDDRFHVV
jgi:hypothetical protein